MWRVYRAIEGIFNIKSKRYCSRRNNVILSANNELHDIVGVWMAEGLLIKHEIFSRTLLNGEHKYDI